MVTDVDLWRAANRLATRRGFAAARVAAQRADNLLAQGDSERRLTASTAAGPIGSDACLTPVEMP
jgi:hypothetical protein